MTQVRFNNKPFEKTFNSLVDDLFSEMPVIYKNDWSNSWKGFVPVNISEDEKSFKLEVIAPGFEKPDFKVSIDKDVLTVSAEKKAAVKEEEKINTEKQIRKEYNYRSFKRSFTLDEKIDAASIEAKYVNGVLTLNLPRKEQVKAPVKDITIQ